MEQVFFYKGEESLQDLFEFTEGKIKVAGGGFITLNVIRNNKGLRMDLGIYPGDIIIKNNKGDFYSCHHYRTEIEV